MNRTSERSAKAQFWSFDLVFAIVIFGFAVTILAYTWFNIDSQLASAYSGSAEIMQMQTQGLSQSLMAAGTPSDWQVTTNTLDSQAWGNMSIGIASSPGGSISGAKLAALSEMASSNYQATKLPLGIGFDYFISIANVPDSVNTVDVSIGMDPNAHGAISVYAQKIPATYGGIPVIVKVELWSNTGFAVG